MSSPQTELPAAKRWLAFGAGLFAATVYGAAWTILNAVLPQMQGDLSASLDQVSWTVTASAVASAIGIPPTASLAARLGLKRLMLTSMTLFTVASAMLAVSDSLQWVVCWRIIQALSGAPVIALSQSITLNSFPEERRGMMLAIWSLGLSAGWVFAPAVGAYMANAYGWRAIFMLLTPMGLLATLACAAFLPRSDTLTARRFDWFGFISISTAIAAFEIAINQGQRLDWFESPRIIACIAIGTLATYIFIAHTFTSRHTFIQWRVFRDRNFTLGIIMVMFFAYVGFVPLVMIPTMLENIKGLEVVTIGLLIVPRGVAQMAAMPLAGYLVNRVDPRLLIGAGLLTFIYGSWIMAHYNLDIGIYDIVWPSVIQGVALAFVWIPVMTMAYSTIDPSMRTDAASLVSLTYSLSSGLAVAASVSILMRSSQIAHEELAAQVVPGQEMLRFPQYENFWDLTEPDLIAGMHDTLTQQAYMIGYANVYWLVLIFAVAAVFMVPFLKGGRAG